MAGPRSGERAIRRWRPWEKSTGPRIVEGKARTPRNAFKGEDRVKLRARLRELRDALNEQAEAIDRFAP